MWTKKPMQMKRIVVNAAAALGLLLAANAVTTAAHAQGGTAPTHDQWRIEWGFKIAPVPLDLKGRNAPMVGLGSYLVNAVGGCNDCHTNPSYADGGNPFMGQKKKANVAHYLAGGQSFGPFISRNLTPENGLPAGHTLSEFLTIMRTGKDFDNPGTLLQVMPWPTYQDLSTYDLTAIYEYLSAIPPATPGP